MINEELLGRPAEASDIDSIDKSKKLFVSCMDEGRYRLFWRWYLFVLKRAQLMHTSFSWKGNIEKYGDSRVSTFLKDFLGGWPLLTANTSSSAASQTLSSIERLIRLRLIGHKPFIDLFVSSNPKEPSNLILRVSTLFIKYS